MTDADNLYVFADEQTPTQGKVGLESNSLKSGNAGIKPNLINSGEILADTWKILIADDDEDVHRMTSLTLSDFMFENKGMTLLHAYSGAQAIELLKEHPDTALILLDVVMETDTAGLDCVRRIRGELRNSDIRIILRTGQPGQAPEKDVIINYDINDYKLKTELTVQKMYTTVAASLRTFMHLKIIEKNRKGLEKIITASGRLFEMNSFQSFSTGILHQLTDILQIEDNSFMVRGSGVAAIQNKDSARYNIIAGAGRFADKVSCDVKDVIPPDMYCRFMEAASTKKNFFYENSYICCLETAYEESSLLYVEWERRLTDVEKNLISIFSINISIAFENVSLQNEINDTQRELIYTMSETIEERSEETASHTKRVAACAALIAADMGLPETDVELLKAAVPLHDIGKIGIPDSILLKKGKLTPDEYTEMKKHAAIGWRLLGKSHRSLLKTAAVIAHEHHEKWDGTGYPRSLAGTEIHLYSRIAALADAVDAIVSKRCYKEAVSFNDMIEIIKSERCRHFDPAVVDSFLRVQDEYRHIVEKF